MTEPYDGPDLSLAEIAPVDLSTDLFDHMVAVAVDPETPAVGDDLLPEASAPGPADDEVDLADLDDDPGPGTGRHDAAEHGDPAPDGGDPVDPAVDPVAYTDPFSAEPGADPSGHTDSHDDAVAHVDPVPSYDDPGV